MNLDFTYLFYSFLIWSHAQPVTAQIVGLLVLIASYGVYWLTIRESAEAKLLSAFDEKTPHGLLKTGPYSYVRHPFYTSYMMLWGGWAIASWNIWAIVPVIGMTVTYWAASRDDPRPGRSSERFRPRPRSKWSGSPSA